LEKVEWWAFNNKALLFLRTYVVLQFLPFSLWKLFDKAANFFFNRPVNVVVRFQKK